MEGVVIGAALSQAGPVCALALACIGSAIGCGIAGMAANTGMVKSSSGHGKFIVMAMAPSSQSIYGLIMMLSLNKAILVGTIDPLSGLFIGVMVGLACLVSAWYQGQVAATAILALTKDESVFGKAFVLIGALESFALFAFIFAQLLF